MQKVSQAFVKAQKEFGSALKTATNPHFRSRYADLSACVEAVIDALNNNGLALMQECHEHDNGVMIETKFIHESGEVLSGGKLYVPATKNDAQGYGSALTYCRRYSLMAACGIAPEDDDGNAASKPKATIIPALPKIELDSSVTKEIANTAKTIALHLGDNMSLAFYEYAGITQEDHKIALWGMLDSKTRKALKDFSKTPEGEQIMLDIKKEME